MYYGAGSGKSMCTLSFLSNFNQENLPVVKTIDVGESYTTMIQNELEWLDYVIHSNVIDSYNESIGVVRGFAEAYANKKLSFKNNLEEIKIIKVDKAEIKEINDYLKSYDIN